MISDEKLAKIEELVCANLNEETITAKASSPASEACLFLIPSSRVGLPLSMLVCMLSEWDSKDPVRILPRWSESPFEANRNKLLDVARETYKENVGDIYQLNKTLADEHALPLTLMYQDSGFVFVLKKTTLDGELPRGFINVSSRRGKWLFSSIELVRILLGSLTGGPSQRPWQRKLNARMKDALDEALILSEKWVFSFLSSLRRISSLLPESFKDSW